jgi:hypothetical protein
MRHDDLVELREGLIVEDAFLDEFVTRHGIRRLARASNPAHVYLVRGGLGL